MCPSKLCSGMTVIAGVLLSQDIGEEEARNRTIIDKRAEEDGRSSAAEEHDPAGARSGRPSRSRTRRNISMVAATHQDTLENESVRATFDEP